MTVNLETVIAVLVLAGAIGNLLEKFPKTERFGRLLTSVTADLRKLSGAVRKGPKP